MTYIIECSGCGTSGPFAVEMKYSVRPKVCSSCHHDETRKWCYHFCTMKCFLKWTQEISKNGGISCQDCVGPVPGTHMMEPTGFHFGFKANGTCPTCEGKKVAKGTS